MAATVLIIANDETMTGMYASYFNKREYNLVLAHSGRQAIAQAKAHSLDAMVLDAASLRLNCKNLCRKLKGASFAPLILITATNAKVDASIQAASILPKPIAGKKLVGRVRTAIDERPPRTINLGKLTLDLEKRKIARGSKSFPLTPKEFILLKALMDHPGQIISRKALMKQVWDTDYMGDTRTLDVHIRWLREKVEDNPSKPQRLVTMRGEGYKIEEES